MSMAEPLAKLWEKLDNPAVEDHVFNSPNLKP
ncbi:hypothetical protein SAMN04515695_0400 [Pseudovibrio sp. Tun.PSC04-5.I4]|nr:hypothetical protein SAMN04515695_0400 [Pseudovibrio sp. Tun.PSC04-5.I4]